MAVDISVDTLVAAFREGRALADSELDVIADPNADDDERAAASLSRSCIIGLLDAMRRAIVAALGEAGVALNLRLEPFTRGA